MEFWNSDITEESWNKLQEMRKSFDFILIGGWAIYLYTKMHKSKDIDIIVDYDVLRSLSSLGNVQKNDRLHKYEIKSGRFDVDIYLPGYSRLALPAEEIFKELNRVVDGFHVPTPEALMVLKLGAAKERLKSIKGEKDAIDILSMLFFSDFNPALFKKIVERNKDKEYPRLLLQILRSADRRIIEYLNLNEKTFSGLKKRWEKELLEIL